MSWWLWLVLGLVLVALEAMAAGGFYLVFFGISALLLGGLALGGFAGPDWVQWLVFTALSVILLLFFRNPLLKHMWPASVPMDRLVGEIAEPVEDIPAGAVGRAELRGTSWSARNLHDAALARGQRCRVQRVDGLMLFLVPE
jgi:membrane protein implicated in regulation of membrane protease activity